MIKQFNDVTTSTLPGNLKHCNPGNNGDIKNGLGRIMTNDLKFRSINSVERIRQ